MKNKKFISIFLGVMFFTLSFAIVLQIKTLQNVNSPFLKIEEDNELRNEILKLKEKYDKTSKQLEKAEKKLTQIREKSAANDSNSLEKEKQIKNNNEVIGLTDITGQGVIITVKQNIADSGLKEDIDSIINELRNSGAEAISINNERIIFNSVIVCKENKLEVNGVILNSPYEIQAIGDSKLIYNNLIRPGGYIELINERVKKADIIKVNKLTIKKYNGNINVQFIKREE